MNRIGRITLWIVIVLSLPLLIVKAFDFAFYRTFHPIPPVANFPPAQDITTAQRQDFEYFQNYFELNRSYTPVAREQAIRLLAEYRAKAGSFTSAQFDLGVARMVALADNGHSRVEPGQLPRRHNSIPCRLYHFSDGYFVIRARPACAHLLGAKVVMVDGRPIEEVADRMYTYFGGPRNHYDQFAAVFFLESPELLQAAGLAAGTDRLNLHVVLRDGSERDATLAADPPDPDAPWGYSDAYLSRQHVWKEAADWVPLLAADAKLPIFLRDYDNPFHSVYWADTGVYFAQFRSNKDEWGHPIGPFVTGVKRDIAVDHPRVIVLDLRLDQGGDFKTTASLMKQLTQAESVEHVFVLTSAWTFSAGEATLVLAKHYGAGKVSVIGEPAGDRRRFWSEGGNLMLPNSKLSIGFATGLMDYSHSCWREPGCFWLTFFYPLQVRTLEPDIRIGYTFQDYVNLRDPLLERALELAGARRIVAR